MTPRVPIVAAVAAAVGCVTLAACGAGASASPADQRSDGSPVVISPSRSGTEPTESPRESPTSAPTATSARPRTPTASAGVFALGDSVMLGARPCLRAAGYRVDALGSRQPAAGVRVLTAARDSGRLPKNVLVHLGTNGGMRETTISTVMKTVGAGRTVVWATIQLPNDRSMYTFEQRTNTAIKAAVRTYRNAVLLDWNALSGRHPGYTWGDGIHVTPSGCRAYAKAVTAVLAGKPTPR